MSRLGILPDQTVSVLGFDDGTLRARIGEREARLAPEMAERIYVAPAPG